MTDFTSEWIAEQRKLLSLDEPNRITMSKIIAEKAIDEIERQAQRIAELEAVNEDQSLTLTQNDYAYSIDKEMMEARVQELEQERRWIPVSERLPEMTMFNNRFSDMVLVWCKGDIFTSSYCENLGTWTHSYLVQPIVTHWQPLPQPPKEE